jgi:hypothetical protein
VARLKPIARPAMNNTAPRKTFFDITFPLVARLDAST